MDVSTESSCTSCSCVSHPLRPPYEPAVIESRKRVSSVTVVVSPREADEAGIECLVRPDPMRCAQPSSGQPLPHSQTRNACTV